MEYVDALFSKDELVQLSKSSKTPYITVIIEVDLDTLIDSRPGDFYEYITEEIAGEYAFYLDEVSYAIKGHLNSRTLLLEVTANISELLELKE